MRIKPRKRLFIVLLFTLEVTLALGCFLLWYIPSLGHENFGRGFSVFMGWVLGTVLTVFTLGIVFLIAVILRGKEVPGARKIRGILIRYLLPVITVIGGIFKIPKDDIRRSFIEINNELVRSSSFKTPPKRVLVLMPHCIQRDVCPHRITVNVGNCRRCGKCDFTELTKTADMFGVDMTVATGGTLARRVIVETRPDLIVGVACERDLSSGIVETYPIPVIGVLIDRPEGPCMNTRVNVELVNQALETFLHRESSAFEREAEKSVPF